MEKIEIVAPAGNMESLKAAVLTGADAVYIGLYCFNARQKAQNFDSVLLFEAVSYCHERGCKIYVAINTVIFTNEKEQLAQVVELCCKAGVDAVVVADIGAALFIKKAAPLLCVHGSTQMSIHTPLGAKLLYDLGFKRVVLARELSKSQIEEIKAATPLELEIFVHGAHCMSLSGQCYMSAFMGGRSANRGFCAQPCRLAFSVKNGTGFDLSLKDLSIISNLDELEEIGVTAVKIEGRLKRPEYVASAVNACFQTRQTGELDQKLFKDLEAIFSRSGFTDGYYKGKTGREMFGVRTPEDEELSKEVVNSLHNLYRIEKSRVGIDIKASFKKNEKSELIINDGVNEVIIFGEIIKENNDKIQDIKRIKEQLSKTGGTPYFINNIEVNADVDIDLSKSQINEQRRLGLTQLSEKRRITKPLKFLEQVINNEDRQCLNKEIEYIARFENIDQISIQKINYFKEIILPLDKLTENKIKNLDNETFKKLRVQIPALMFGHEQKIKSQLLTLLKLGINKVLCGNWGSIELARELKLDIMGDFSLNVTNDMSVQALMDLNVNSAVLSLELSTRLYSKTLKDGFYGGAICYGHIPVMRVKNCPGKNGDGCKSCDGVVSLTDRKGKIFNVICGEVLNCVPIYKGDKDNLLKGLDFGVFYFTTESRERTEKVIELYFNKRPFDGEFTRANINP